MNGRIRTTVVGSYPVLPWMMANPSRPVLRDAIMTVLKTQELAGLDLLTDGVVVDKVGEGALNLLQDYEFVSGLTKSPLKFTCTGPHMLARLLTNCFYKDPADLAMDIAEVLRRQLELLEAHTVQLDEASIVGFPEDSAWASEAINHVLSGVLNESAVHICFGNYGGQSMLRGFWRDLVPFL